MTHSLGLDLGTQGLKALLLDAESSQVVARASVSYGLLPGLPEGCAEQDPLDWRRALAEVLQQLHASSGVAPGQIVAVGVSGQQHGAVALDAAGDPLRAAKLWCDTSTSAEAAELSAAFGWALPTGFSASKWLWMARHEPENWTRCTQLLLPHDYLNLLLTGEAAMEAGDASGTGVLDIQARRFDPAALAAFDELAQRQPGVASLASRLPRLMDPTQPQAALGRVHAGAAAEFGLPEGALVSAGGGDNMMSAIGSGATRAGVVSLSLGTSGTVFAHSDSPIQDPEGLIAGFCGSSGGWLPLLCVMNLTGVLEEVRQGFGGTHAALTEAARRVNPGCDGLLWVPYLNGERVPDLPQARGRLLGMRPGQLRAGTLYRAALEGTSLNLAWGFERLCALGIEAAELRLVGGAARNPLWREILAASFGLPVVPLVEPESAALGAALQALWCWTSEAGEETSLEALSQPCIQPGEAACDPDPAWVEHYAALQERFRRLALQAD